MARPKAVARVLGGDRLECRLTTRLGATLTLTGSITDTEPEVEGEALDLGGNRALLHNAWAFAKFTHLKVHLPTAEEQKIAAKRAETHRHVAEWIADIADDLTSEEKSSWCSGCFEQTRHRRAKLSVGQVPAYVCSSCGTPTLSCAAPGCQHMAVRGRGAVRLPRYCAEHRHEIPSFAKAGEKIDALGDYKEFLEYEKPNLARATKLVGAGAAAATGAGLLAYLAAPAIGGAVGTLAGGYSGAVAANYGLALLGGGSLAAGGLGMAGGTMVVAALGTALGGGLGATIANAYVREDKSFHIEMLKGGDGVPVIVCNGWLSEGNSGWGSWKDLVTNRYPDSPVYRVQWGAKELRDLGVFAGGGAAQVGGVMAVRQAALHAAKAAAKRLGPLTPALLAASLAKNPWHVARNRAEKTGVIVAELLARTKADSYVLIGHSLGARATVVAAQTLGTDPDGPRIEAVHLTGAAIGAKGDWTTLTVRVDEAVYNYHSSKDKVLKFLYSTAEGGQKAAGLTGFVTSDEKVKNIDVSAQVNGHSDYYKNISLR